MKITELKSMSIVTSIAILGSFSEWKAIERKCNHSAQDKSGVGVGIISREIKTDFGNYHIKFLLMYIDDNLRHKLKPTYQFTYQEVVDEGFEQLLARIGKKVIINIQLKMKNKNIEIIK
ncbi:MAG: hypothetical protein ACXACU_15260 [Candidatus Hodarchaeales archaeon]|jgi:hypothetical protein